MKMKQEMQGKEKFKEKLTLILEKIQQPGNRFIF